MEIWPVILFRVTNQAPRAAGCPLWRYLVSAGRRQEPRS